MKFVVSLFFIISSTLSMASTDLMLYVSCSGDIEQYHDIYFTFDAKVSNVIIGEYSPDQVLAGKFFRQRVEEAVYVDDESYSLVIKKGDFSSLDARTYDFYVEFDQRYDFFGSLKPVSLHISLENGETGTFRYKKEGKLKRAKLFQCYVMPHCEEEKRLSANCL